MTVTIPFDNSYARLPDRFYTRMKPTPVQKPELLKFNAELASEMGIAHGKDEELAEIFSGNLIPEGAEPLAQVYAGHQFGGFSPRLGDGRANLLGEALHAKIRRDIHLKGSGPTPYSRMGDGRAWLGPVLREYVISEAMHALGIPTTRALAAVATGEPVYREEGSLPGAVIARTASSHIRVGTFQYFWARRDVPALESLFEHVVERHYPQASDPLDLLNAVMANQASLVAKWMSIGFIHGVMNTDNTTISGETIDYGPCAFMDKYDERTVFSSIDHHGRYAYCNQPNVIVWNMAQFASTLVALMPNGDHAVEIFTKSVQTMPNLIKKEWLKLFGQKIGISDATEADTAIIGDLLKRMQNGGADFTNTFRALAEGKAAGQFKNPDEFREWERIWRQRLKSEPDPESAMLKANPAYMPRNHRIELMIQSAVYDDLKPFERLLSVFSRPYESQPDAEYLKLPPEPHEVVQRTFCGT
ncbi:MAG: YdiU family protein [Roseovarius sp.]|nr:YdiU family protein [Roseovarius sp.]MCY4314675.1 YdiU family protein [Roseovarius sp.]